MTTSQEITEGQIGRVLEILGAQLRKHKAEFPSEAVQQALGVSTLPKELLQVFRSHVEVVSNFVIRTVRVNRTRTRSEAIDATGRVKYLHDDVVQEMPSAEWEEGEIIFFKIGKDISCKQLEEEYEKRGLVPVDPVALAAFNEAEPTFADEHPNATQWKDAYGKYCYALFERWSGARHVRVHRSGRAWDDPYSFAGVRK